MRYLSRRGLIPIALALAVLGPAPGGQALQPPGLELVSVASDGTPGNGSSDYASISADGRFVAFRSLASNLVPGDTNGVSDIFVRDRQTGQTWRVSVDSDGNQADDASDAPEISADGRFVAFDSGASNLVPADTNDDQAGFIRDLQTDQTERISVASDGGQFLGWNGESSISSDGRFVAFRSATDIERWDVFVHDRLTGLTELASTNRDGRQANSSSGGQSISGDGRFVAFASRASDLAPNDTNLFADIFVRDRQTGKTERVSIGSGGHETDALSEAPSVNDDGRFVAFLSGASNLVPGDANAAADVFVHDRQTGQTDRATTGHDGSEANGPSEAPAISADAGFVAFWSAASNLVPSDTNGSYDVFVRDRLAGRTERIEVGGWYSLVSISGDGRVVTFSSRTPNLVSGDTNDYHDVFVYDRCPGGVCPPQQGFVLTPAPTPAPDSVPAGGGPPGAGGAPYAAAIALIGIGLVLWAAVWVTPKRPSV